MSGFLKNSHKCALQCLEHGATFLLRQSRVGNNYKRLCYSKYYLYYKFALALSK